MFRENPNKFPFNCPLSVCRVELISEMGWNLMSQISGKRDKNPSKYLRECNGNGPHQRTFWSQAQALHGMYVFWWKILEKYQENWNDAQAERSTDRQKECTRCVGASQAPLSKWKINYKGLEHGHGHGFLGEQVTTYIHWNILEQILFFLWQCRPFCQRSFSHKQGTAAEHLNDNFWAGRLKFGMPI